MSDNEEEEIPKTEIKLKKKKTRLKKLDKEKNENEMNIDNDNSRNQINNDIVTKKRSKTVYKMRKKRINLENDLDNENPKKRKRRKKRKRKEEKEDNAEENSSHNSEKEDNDNNDEEKSTKKRKKKKRKKKKKLDNDENDNIEKENIDNNINEEDNISNKENNIEEDNNKEEDNNNEDKTNKKKRRKKKKRLITKEEPDDNDEKDNIDADNNINENINIDDDNNEEGLSEKKKKKRRKKRKKKSKDEKEKDNEDNSNENEENNNNNEDLENNFENENNEFSKTVKKKKKKKRKKREKKTSFDNNNKILINGPRENENKIKLSNLEKAKTRTDKLMSISQRPITSNTLRSAKKTFNLDNNFEENDLNNKVNEINNNNNNNIKKDFDNYDMNWKSVKKKFLKEIEEIMNELKIYDTIDIALISTTNCIKKEYGKFKINNHHEICPLKNYNNINWAKEPFSLLKNKLYDFSSQGNLIEKYNLFDFSNRACNEYEVYNAKINILKISGTNLKEKIKPETYSFISKEDKDKIKPTLILFFSLNDEKSINIYKETLNFLNNYKEDIIFMPIYAPLIQEEKNIYFVMDILYNYEVYKTGDKFDIYFCMDDALNKRFKYISEDNKRTITNKIIYLDVFNNGLIVRAIKELDNFSFNLINKNKIINKEKYKSTLKNLFKLKKSPSAFLKDTPLVEPFNCNWILKKAKIYHISKEGQELKVKRTLYDGLTGYINREQLYSNERKKSENLLNLFNNLGNYQMRSNPVNLSLSHKQINKLIIKEMSKCLNSNKKIKEVNYQSIFQTNKIILSIGSQFNIQKFMPIKLNSFKLELQVNIDLFEEYDPLNIIGTM